MIAVSKIVVWSIIAENLTEINNLVIRVCFVVVNKKIAIVNVLNSEEEIFVGINFLIVVDKFEVFIHENFVN